MKTINGGTFYRKSFFLAFSFAILLISLSLLVSSEQSTYQKKDYLTLVSNTPHCLDNCETVYRLCPNDASDTTFDLHFKEKSGQKQKSFTSQKSFKTEIKGGSFNLKELKVDYKKPVAVEVGVYGDCQQNITHTNNETQQQETISVVTRCIIGTATEWREGKEWETFTAGKIKDTQSCFSLRVRGIINWGDYVDNIISFAGYTYDEYAEWTGDVLQHTLTADFAGNGTNVTNGNDKLALSSGGAGGSSFVYDALENNSLINWGAANQNGEPFSDGCEINSSVNGPLNGSFSLGAKKQGASDVQCARFAQNYSVNHKGWNVSFGFKLTTNPTDQSFDIGLTATNTTTGTHGDKFVLNRDCGASNLYHFCYEAVSPGADTGLGCNIGNYCNITIEINATKSGSTAAETTIWLHVNGTKSNSITASFTPDRKHYLIFQSLSPGSSALIDDIKFTNGSTSDGILNTQGDYYSQKIDTGTENESIRINVSTNNASAVKFEARVSNTSAGLDVLDWTVFTHNTDLSTKGRWLQYRFNFTHDLSEVTEVNVSRRFDVLGNEQGDEANARTAIDTTVSTHLSGTTISTAQQVYLRNASGSQASGTFDKAVSWQGKRWLINYLTGSDTAINAFNITPVVYTLEMQNLTLSQIQQRVGQFINNTR